MKTNFSKIIETLADTTEELKSGKIDVNIAKQICNNTQTLINAAKLQFELMKYNNTLSSEFFSENKTIKEQPAIGNTDIRCVVERDTPTITTNVLDKNKNDRTSGITDYRKFNNDEFKNKELEKEFNSGNDDYKSKIRNFNENI